MQVPANKGRLDIYTETELEEKIKDSVPDGTRKKVRWALNILKEWQNETLNDESRLHMYGDMETSPALTINNELKHFICEIRKKNGSRYPPKTLYDLIVMLNYYLTKEVRRDLNIMKDKEFLETRMALNAAMSESADTSLVAGSNASEPIPNDEEDLLFESGILGTSTPKHILNTAIYLLAVHTSVRGSRTQEFKSRRELSISVGISGRRRSSDLQADKGQELSRKCHNITEKSFARMHHPP